MSVPRQVEPELVDELLADDPRPRRSRHSREFVNAFMLQGGITAHLLKLHAGAPLRTLIDLGGDAGSGFDRGIVACEPRRLSLALFSSKTSWALGCNELTCHDAVVSVNAGFNGQELSRLWPTREPWKLRESGAWLFGHLSMAPAP